MPDNKLTDNEIIKALKTLLELVLVEGCLQRAKTISLALDLINRLKKENKNYSQNNRQMTKDILDLQKELKRVISWRDVYKKETHKYLDAQMYLAKQCDKLQDENDRLQAENERLHKEVGYWEAETKEARADIDQAVAEAYKEFAEMVIAELDDRKQTVIGAREKILKKTNGFRNDMVCQLDSSVSHYMGTIDLIKTILKKLVGDNGNTTSKTEP